MSLSVEDLQVLEGEIRALKDEFGKMAKNPNVSQKEKIRAHDEWVDAIRRIKQAIEESGPVDPGVASHSLTSDLALVREIMKNKLRKK